MSDTNITVIAGRLTSNPFVSSNGKSVGLFRLATNDRYRDKAGVVHNNVAYVPCKVFGGWTASLTGREKGDMVVVTGKLRTESLNKEGTNPELVLICDSLRFVESEPKSQTNLPTSIEVAEGKETGKPPF